MTTQNNQKQQDSEALDQNNGSTIDNTSKLYDSAAERIDEQTQDAPSETAISALEAEIQILKDQLIRALAETENVRKRAQREREDASRFAVTSFAKDLVNVADNLRRALGAIPAEILAQSPQIKNLTDGIEATERELLKTFEKNGIQRIEPLDQPFDANFHEVMFEAPIPDKPNGTVIQVIETGYTISGRLLRPARVGVSKAESATPSAQKPSGNTIDTQA